jgi:hypothetical protein
MESANAIINSSIQGATLDDVNRLLDLGRLLLSVLTPGEIKTIQALMPDSNRIDQIGNTGDS